MHQLFSPQEANGFGLRGLVMEVQEHNEATIRVCERLEFRREGRHLAANYHDAALFALCSGSAERPKPGYVNMLRYALLRDESMGS